MPHMENLHDISNSILTTNTATQHFQPLLGWAGRILPKDLSVKAAGFGEGDMEINELSVLSSSGMA